jgi:hypothetical protein
MQAELAARPPLSSTECGAQVPQLHAKGPHGILQKKLPPYYGTRTSQGAYMSHFFTNNLWT